MQLVITTLDSSAGLENYTKVYAKREDIWQAFQQLTLKAITGKKTKGFSSQVLTRCFFFFFF